MKTITVEREVTVPKNTAQSSPLRTELPVAKGMVLRTKVTFPPGPAGLTGIRVRHGGVQVIPARLTEWLIGDDITYTYEQALNLWGTDGKLTVEAYNTDTIYDHTIIFTFDVVYAEKSIEELLLELLKGKLDLKLSDLATVLTTILATLTEIRAALSELGAREERRRQEEERARLLKEVASLSVEELVRF